MSKVSISVKDFILMKLEDDKTTFKDCMIVATVVSVFATFLLIYYSFVDGNLVDISEIIMILSCIAVIYVGFFFISILFHLSYLDYVKDIKKGEYEYHFDTVCNVIADGRYKLVKCTSGKEYKFENDMDSLRDGSELIIVTWGYVEKTYSLCRNGVMYRIVD